MARCGRCVGTQLAVALLALASAAGAQPGDFFGAMAAAQQDIEVMPDAVAAATTGQVAAATAAVAAADSDDGEPVLIAKGPRPLSIAAGRTARMRAAGLLPAVVGARQSAVAPSQYQE
jgi:hypothetical protein